MNSGNFAAQATILSVNGGAPDTTAGITALGSSVYTNTEANNNIYGGTEAYYVDLSVDIPATANAVLVDFGQSDGNGMYINAIQAAYVPEPASLGILGVGSLTLLARRRRRA